MRLTRRFAAFAVVLATSACANTPPRFDPVADQVAYVDRAFRMSLRATDEEGDDLSFSFGSDIRNISTRAAIEPVGDGRAIFSFTPISSDSATDPLRVFDFTVSDGMATDTIAVGITIETPLSESSSPVFVRPLGNGTTVALDATPCIHLDIEVADEDSRVVNIDHGAPFIVGAWVEQIGPLTGAWHWCPSAEQRAASDRYALTLTASDHENPATVKSYLIVLSSR